MKTLLFIAILATVLLSACGPEPTLDPVLLRDQAWLSYVEMDKTDTAITQNIGPWLIGLVVISGLATAVVCASSHEQRHCRATQSHARKWW